MNDHQWFLLIAFLVIQFEIWWAVREINAAAYNRQRELLQALKDLETTISAGFFGPKQ